MSTVDYLSKRIADESNQDASSGCMTNVSPPTRSLSPCLSQHLAAINSRFVDQWEPAQSPPHPG